MSNIRTSNLEFPILLVKGIPYGTHSDQLYQIFQEFGNIQEIRTSTEGTQAFVIYKNYSSCLAARDKLRGYNLNGKYLAILIYHPEKEKVVELQEKLSQDKISQNA